MKMVWRSKNSVVVQFESPARKFFSQFSAWRITLSHAKALKQRFKQNCFQYSSTSDWPSCCQKKESSSGGSRSIGGIKGRVRKSKKTERREAFGDCQGGGYFSMVENRELIMKTENHVTVGRNQASKKSLRNGSPKLNRKQFYKASIHQCNPEPLPDKFVRSIKDLEALLKMPVWFIVQNGACEYSSIAFHIYKGFQSQRGEIRDRVALLLESPGGEPDFAYRIARLIQRRTRDFIVIVPQYAKSAATLIALGANQLILANDAELGPLDIQLFDREREDTASALETVQSLERLSAFSLRTIDQTMLLLSRRSPKTTDVLLPIVLDYAAKFVKPLLDKIDTVDYTLKSRELKVAEEYAVRLMKTNYPDKEAKEIVSKLVEYYPTHGFVIDSREAEHALGLRVKSPSREMESILQSLGPYLDTINAAGRLEIFNENHEEKNSR